MLGFGGRMLDFGGSTAMEREGTVQGRTRAGRSNGVEGGGVILRNAAREGARV
jgi:hypothetical protein